MIYSPTWVLGKGESSLGYYYCFLADLTEVLLASCLSFTSCLLSHIYLCGQYPHNTGNTVDLVNC